MVAFKLKFADKRLIFALSGFLLLFASYMAINLVVSRQKSNLLSPLGKTQVREKPLEKYSFENLKKRRGKPSQINLERVLTQHEGFTAYLFSFESDGRKITGLAHLPKKEGKLPVVVMLRGYVDQEQYQTGVGTQPAAEVYAANGFITLAPDYLGYGESDMPPPGDIWEERFLRHVAVADLLASVATLPQADTEKIFLWGHSNGGMQALTALELSGGNYPTVLWAPVSQYFPYDVLYYTNEADDGGKSLRQNLAEFEKDYDTDDYSIGKHFDWIKAPVQLHQGTADPYIPLSWSDDLASSLKKQGLEVDYYLYPGNDHNLRPDWDTVVARDLAFFKKYL